MLVFPAAGGWFKFLKRIGDLHYIGEGNAGHGAGRYALCVVCIQSPPLRQWGVYTTA